MENLIQRGAGILCHISSLPGKYGIGTIGKEAYAFADFLRRAHVKYWQILPLAQTGYGDSPYSSVCCNSGNPYFIDLEALRDEGLLDDEELASCEMPEGEVDYGELYNTRFNILRLAYARFDIADEDFVKFVESGEFDDYAVFMSLKNIYSGSFKDFPDSYKYAENLAIKEFREANYKSDYCFWIFVQYVFKKQWLKLKEYVNSLGIQIIGDLPLYVAYDSADVWARPELFCLDEDLNPTEVAGVPPDYFSPTGQLWGNPVYNWDVLESERYEWWINRIRKMREMVDVVRIDHFRGFDRYYSIPADSETAETGEWKQGPGLKFFIQLRKKLGNVPVIAEDLGVIDYGVEKLRQRTDYPGMKIMLFAFDGKLNNPYLPRNIQENAVVYSGTHDNATALGLLKRMNDSQFLVFKSRLRAALKDEGVVFPFKTRAEAARALCVSVLASKANLAVLPIQDLLGMGDESRMNTPSVATGNWKFRLKEIPSRYDTAIMRKMVKEYNR
ncbi:MAG: 4-alpha-glucanotransferase [Clostridia bacterium]|nr:4-alpha-glucanotransferase [Clostridia bacterium]